MQIEELIIKETYCANECSAATAVAVLTQDHRDQCWPSSNPATKPLQDRWRYCVVGAVVQIKCFFSGWWKAHTHSASCWVAAETPSLMYQPHRAQRERLSYPGTNTPFTVQLISLFTFASFLQVNAEEKM